MKELWLFLLLGCSGAAYITPGYIDPEEGGEHLVVLDKVYTYSQAWREAPWYRLTDEPIAPPIFIMIDGSGAACVVPGDVYALQPRAIACPTGWRRPRL